MGVTGLWKLIEPVGKPVPVETLEGKILAVDISIWLHQVVKGYQDSKGSGLDNAHLLGLFHRLCKLLYYRVKPVFVFDGCVPKLKRDTIMRRQQQRNKLNSEADRIQTLLLQSLAKEKVVQQALGVGAEQLLKSPIKSAGKSVDKDSAKDDLFKLPALPACSEQPQEDDSEEECSFTTLSDDSSCSTSCDSSMDESSARRMYNSNIQAIDVKSKDFLQLPVDVRYEILTDIKETRKQSSWGRLHELPSKSDDFSLFQMKRLLRRHAVQESLVEVEKEMGGPTISFAELRDFFSDNNNTNLSTLESYTKQICSDENTRYLLVNDLKRKITEAEKQENQPKDSEEEAQTTERSEERPQSSNQSSNNLNESPKPEKTGQVPSAEEATEEMQAASDSGEECDYDLQKAIALSLEETRVYDEKDYKYDGDMSLRLNAEQSKQLRCTTKGPARAYMIEYAGINNQELENITEYESKQPKKTTAVHSKEVCVIEDSESESDESDWIEVQPAQVEPEKRIEIIVEPIENLSAGTDMFAEIFQPVQATQSPAIESKVSKDSLQSILDDIKQKIIKVPTTTFQLQHAKATEVDINLCTEDVPASPLKNDAYRLAHEKSQQNISASDLNPIKKIDVTEHNPIIVINDCADTDFNKETSLDTPPKPSKAIEMDVPSKKNNQDEQSYEMTLAAAASTLKAQNTDAKLQQMAKDLAQERREFEFESNRQERMGMSITHRMSLDCQELLRLFGMPYIVAPMEAEAQCAFLDAADLTNGTITDDSDIWLFGGRTVYKNFFAQNKHVLEFRDEQIQKTFHCDRNKLVQLACLVGSDYTTGVSGIGAVTALEIIASFAGTSTASTKESNQTSTVIQSVQATLAKFRDWWHAYKNSSTIPGSSARVALQKKLKNIELWEGFPSTAVIEAYLKPTIDDNKEAFAWGYPDVESIKEFTRKAFGWTALKTDTVLSPVLRKINDKTKQRSIRNYFAVKSGTASSSEHSLQVSKRVRTAIQKMSGNSHSEDDPKDKEKEKRPSGSKRKAAASEVNTAANREQSSKALKGADDSVASGSELKKCVRLPNPDQEIPQRQRRQEQLRENKERAVRILKQSVKPRKGKK